MNGEGNSTDPPVPPPKVTSPLAADPPSPLLPQAEPSPTILERVRGAPITFAILVINVAVFLWAEKHGSTEQTGVLLRFGAIEPVHVWMGEYWRLATYMFLHIGWMHLLWNSYASVGWSTAVERALGKGRFLVVYLVSGIGGGAISVVLSPAVSAGASGAMFGIVGATLALRRRQLPSLSAFVADKGARATFFSIALWTVIGLTALRMNHYAHFGGLAVGVLATWIATSPSARAAKWAAFGALFVALVVAAIHPQKPSGSLKNGIPAFAYVYLHGEAGIEKDVARGTRIATRGCENDVPKACFVLGASLTDANDSAQDRRAYDLFDRGCTAGDDDSCGGMGWSILHGRGVPKDEARGTKLLADACAKGSKNSCAISKSDSVDGPADSK